MSRVVRVGVAAIIHKFEENEVVRKMDTLRNRF